MYSAQASFARPRTTSAQRLLAFFGLYPSSLSKSAGLASLAGNASLVSIPDASLRGRRKKGRGRGWGREKSAKEGKRGKGNLPLFSSSLSPTPFDACYTGWLMLNTISRMLAFLFAVGIPETLGILQIATAIAIYLGQLYITNNTTKHCRTLYCNLEKEKKRGRKRERKKDELRELKQSTK